MLNPQKLNLLDKLNLPASLRERALRGWLEEEAVHRTDDPLSGRRTAVHQTDDPLSGRRTAVHQTDDPLSGQAALVHQAAERREVLQAQARLLRLFERPKPEERAQALQEARRLLELDSPLRGYALVKDDPTNLELFLDAVLARMGHAFSGHTLEVVRALLHLALEAGLQRGYHPFTSEVLFHLPQGALGAALWPEAQPETARKRVQRALDRLQEAGLLAAAPRVGNARDRQTGQLLGWKDGTVFRVRLKPGRARVLSREEIAYPWRDLEADIRQGRTLPRLSQSINTQEESKSPLKKLIKWALPPVILKTPLSDWDTPGDSRRTIARNALQNVKNCLREERRASVGEMGTLLAQLFSDRQSAGLYRALLWGALRRLDRGEDRFEALWAAIDRALVDLEEGFAKKPGALLTSRLKASGLWAFLMEGPQYRVA